MVNSSRHAEQYVTPRFLIVQQQPYRNHALLPLPSCQSRLVCRLGHPVNTNPLVPGALQPLQPVQGPAVWYADDWKAKKEAWCFELQPTHVTELEAAVAHAKATGKEYQDMTQQDFPLPTLAKELDSILHEVIQGKGFQLLKGIPVDKWGHEDSLLAYWGICLYWGKAVRQNGRGHLLGHVKDINPPGGHKNPVNRLYSTHGAQPYHVDPADIVGLLCLKTAKEGGHSYWSSSWTVHNELLKQNPDLVHCLAGEWYVDRKNEIPEGKAPYYKLPIFNYHGEKLCVFYENGFYQLVERFAEVPRLTDMQWKALEAFETLAHDPRLRMDYVLEPGDIQLLHNHQIVHARTQFEDYQEEDRKRHLLRMWLSHPADWQLPEAFGERYNSTVVPGERGGIVIPGVPAVVPLQAGTLKHS